MFLKDAHTIKCTVFTHCHWDTNRTPRFNRAFIAVVHEVCSGATAQLTSRQVSLLNKLLCNKQGRVQQKVGLLLWGVRLVRMCMLNE